MSREALRGGTSFAPSIPDLTFCAVALAFAVGAPVQLTQSDGDLFAHIRLGDAILASGHVPTTSLFGFATDGVGMISPAWLSEVLFAIAYRAGGLALIATLVAILAGTAHAGVAQILRRRGVDARWTLVATLVSVLLGATHWLARPHAFSILAAVLLLALLEWDDRRAIPWIGALMVLWTNLHGGWVYGLGLVALYAAGDAADAWRIGGAPPRARRRRHAMALAVAALATLANPYGLALHREIWRTLADTSLASNIVEYQPPSFRVPGDAGLLVALVAGGLIVAASRLRMRAAWLLVIAANVVLALSARRNIALFGVTAWPLLALEASAVGGGWLARRRAFGEFARIDARSRVGIWALPAMVLLLAVGASGGSLAGRRVISSVVDPARFPVQAVARMREGDLEGRIFTPWTWGGYLVLAWPGRQAFVDPLKFSAATIADYGAIADVEVDWRRQLDHWGVAVVVVPPDTRLARALAAEPEWERWYEDGTAVVMRRMGREWAGVSR